MYKFVVLCALVAVAVAAPGVLHGGHLGYSAHVAHPLAHSTIAHHGLAHGLAVPAISTYSTHGLINTHGIHSAHAVAPIAVAHAHHGVHGVHGIHGVHVL